MNTMNDILRLKAAEDFLKEASQNYGKPEANVEKIRDLKNQLKKSGQNFGLNGKPISFLLGKWCCVYEYVEGVMVKFETINYKVPTDVAMYISIDADKLLLNPRQIEEYPVFYEDYLLRYYNDIIGEVHEKFSGTDKLERLKTKIQIQKPDCRIVRRSGLLYRKEKEVFVMKLLVLFPSGSGISILGEKMSKMITGILQAVVDGGLFIDRKDMQDKLECYKKQIQIRHFCKENGFVAFVADGSILPRKGESEKPLKTALAFQTPESLKVTIPFSDGSVLSGMGIAKGITVITGAGFSGKTTLLEAINAGIYNHIAGDGREYVVSDGSLTVTNAEDGRYVANEDVSLFFSNIPFHDIKHFSTTHASGSVSQAANIIEALSGGCKLLTMDEDKCATNFMIRDSLIRTIVKKEVIIPLTDRLKTLVENMDISVIMVIGGSGEYLKIADTVIMMESYEAQDVTENVKRLKLHSECEEKDNPYIPSRELQIKGGAMQLLAVRTLCTQDSKKVFCGNNVADLTALDAITNNEQLHSLARIMRKVYSDCNEGTKDINALSEECVNQLFLELEGEQTEENTGYRGWWFEEIRREDVKMCFNRMKCL